MAISQQFSVWIFVEISARKFLNSFQSGFLLKFPHGNVSTAFGMDFVEKFQCGSFSTIFQKEMMIFGAPDADGALVR